MATLALFNARDGVGKTTTAVNLLAGLARRGTRPLGIDLDPAAALSRVFGQVGVPPSESSYACLALDTELGDLARISASGVIVCPAHPELARVERITGKGPAAITRLARELAKPALDGSVTVIDCAAAIGVPTLNALFAADLLLVPIAPDYLAMKAAQQVERALKALEPVMKKRLARRYLLTRVDAARQISADIEALVRVAFPAEEILATTIREDESLSSSLEARLDVFRHLPESAGALDYEAMLSELAAGPLPALC